MDHTTTMFLLNFKICPPFPGGYQRWRKSRSWCLMAEAISWAAQRPLWPSRCFWAGRLWSCAVRASICLPISTEISWSTWPFINISGNFYRNKLRLPGFSAQEDEHQPFLWHFQAPATSSGRQCKACHPTRPRGARLLWSALRCLTGSHDTMTRKSGWWFLLPSRLCAWSLLGSLPT